MDIRSSWLKGRRVRALIATAAISTLALAGCGGGSAPTDNSPGDSNTSQPPGGNDGDESPGEIQTGGTIKVGSLSEFGGFDPVNLVSVGTGIERAVQVMDSLLFRDEVTDEVTGKLAKGMTSDDGKVWTLELRPDVNFTDGTPLDAEAVIFNIERHLAEDSRSNAKALLMGIESMEAKSDLEVVFTLSEVDGSFPLTFTGSTPAGVIGSPAALADPEAFNDHPVGAGPFKFESWVKDDTLTLVKNEDYWDEGKPYLDSVIYHIRPDPQVRADDLASGSIDFTQISAAMWPRISSTPGVDLHIAPAGGENIVPNASKGIFQDKRLRKAAQLVFDGPTTAGVLAGGTELWDGDTACIPWAPGAPACEGATAITADVEKAKELVAEYTAEHGEPTVEYVHYAGSASAEFVQQQLASIGITAVMKAMDPVSHAVAQATGDYELLQGTTVSAGYPTLWTRLHSSGQNWGQVVYPELEDALNDARNGATLEERASAWKRVSDIVEEEAIVVWYSPNLSGQGRNASLHIGDDDYPWDGSMLPYFGTAWLEQ